VNISRRVAAAMAASLGFLLVGGASASPSHLGQPPSHFVTLEVVGAGSFCASKGYMNLDFQRNLSDGSSVYPFKIPAGQVLVVTDMDWQWNAGTPNSRQTLRVFLVSASSFSRVFESTIELNGSGEGGTSEAATAGFVVSPAASICLDAIPGGGVLNHLLLRGYLAPNK
jgi:hypothetical protein